MQPCWASATVPAGKAAQVHGLFLPAGALHAPAAVLKRSAGALASVAQCGFRALSDQDECVPGYRCRLLGLGVQFNHRGPAWCPAGKTGNACPASNLQQWHGLLTVAEDLMHCPAAGTAPLGERL